MDLIDEQHIASLQIREQRREIPRTLEHRAGSGLDSHVHLVSDDVGKRGFAQPRRTEDERVI